jgi:hypothetical protein
MSSTATFHPVNANHSRIRLGVRRLLFFLVFFYLKSKFHISPVKKEGQYNIRKTQSQQKFFENQRDRP